MIKQIIFFLLICYMGFMIYNVYHIGYYIGKDDCLIEIEKEITDIRNRVKEYGSSWEDYYKETALLKLHRKLEGKE